jgi:hypothetical protein
MPGSDRAYQNGQKGWEPFPRPAVGRRERKNPPIDSNVFCNFCIHRIKCLKNILVIRPKLSALSPPY